MFALLYFVFKGHLTLGQMITMQFYSFFIFGPLQELGNIILAYREAQASLSNFDALMNKPVEAKPASPIALGEIHNLQFDQVSFQHKTAKQAALNSISFSVEKGKTIAFVGPSGSGKTTLVKLLVGLYTPIKGHVLYNQLSHTSIDFEELRHQIGLVTQDTQLFSGTIRENLLFVRPTATDEECMDVLHKAACENLLARASKGLDTVIGEGTKMDNMVHIGHDVVVGKNCLFAAQVGIGGATVIEDGVILWGQVGVSKTLTIGANAVVMAQTGVPSNLAGGKVYFGYPAEEAVAKKRELVWIKRIPEMWEMLKKINYKE
jgi:ABC-type Fe3+/spermidine/putrescine transport system ATPase subunit